MMIMSESCPYIGKVEVNKEQVKNLYISKNLERRETVRKTEIVDLYVCTYPTHNGNGRECKYNSLNS